MNTQHKQDFTDLLVYQHTVTKDDFVEQITTRVALKRRNRKRLLILSGIVATITAALLVGVSTTSTWEPMTQFIRQSPVLLASASVVGLIGGLLIRAEES